MEKPGFLRTPAAASSRGADAAAAPWRRVAFFAYDRAAQGTVPIVAGDKGLRIGESGAAGAIFHALPGDAKSPPAAAKPLYEFLHDDGAGQAYSTDGELRLPNYRRSQRPFCLVW